MRSLVAASVGLVALALVGCGQAMDEGSSSLAQADSNVDPCTASRAPGLACTRKSLPGAFVTRQSGRYTALVLDDAHCGDPTSFCFFGQMHDGTRIEGTYARIGNDFELAYTLDGVPVVDAMFFQHLENGDLVLHTNHSPGETPEVLSPVASWCMVQEDCRDQDVTPAVCIAGSEARGACVERSCVQTCEAPRRPFVATTVDAAR